MKSINEIKERVIQLEQSEEETVKELKNCDCEQYDHLVARLQIIRHEIMILGWVLQ